MKESYGEDPASHTGPESCAVAREGRREALTGVCAGEPLSREIIRIRSADAVSVSGRHIPWGPVAVMSLEYLQPLSNTGRAFAG